jgi:hypothetical protein
MRGGGRLGDDEGGELDHRRLLRVVPAGEGKRRRVVLLVTVFGARRKRRAARAAGWELAVPIAR